MPRPPAAPPLPSSRLGSEILVVASRGSNIMYVAYHMLSESGRVYAMVLLKSLGTLHLCSRCVAIDTHVFAFNWLMPPSRSHILRCAVHTSYAQVHAHCIPSACLSSATGSIHTYDRRKTSRQDKARWSSAQADPLPSLSISPDFFSCRSSVSGKIRRQARQPRPDVSGIDRCCWSSCFCLYST